VTAPDEHTGFDAAGPHTVYGLIAFGCTVALLITDRLIARGDNALLHALGIVALLLSPAFIVPPFFHLPKYGRSAAGTYYATRWVVDRGLYAVVRHPQYLGYALMAAGFALLSQHVVTVTLGAGAIATFYIHTLHEEAFCAKRFGEQYRTYMQRVPRFNAVRGLWLYWRTISKRKRS
jgi:protein-S-isoprenylcysteine O-methyltransferase Ste14